MGSSTDADRIAIKAPILIFLFALFLSVIQTLVDHICLVWWYACQLVSYWHFSDPLLNKGISNLSYFCLWYIFWVVFLKELNSTLACLESGKVIMSANLSLFLSTFVSTILVLLVFHLLLWFGGRVLNKARKRPNITMILQYCCVVSMACSEIFWLCDNHSTTEQKDFSWLSFWNKREGITKLAVNYGMNELTNQACSLWLVPIGSTTNHLLFSVWANSNKIARNTCVLCSSSLNDISSLCLLWTTFIGLYIVSYVLEMCDGIQFFSKETNVGSCSSQVEGDLFPR